MRQNVLRSPNAYWEMTITCKAAVHIVKITLVIRFTKYRGFDV